MLAVSSDIAIKFLMEKRQEFHEKYPYIVRNKFSCPATMLENAVFLFAGILFAALLVMSFRVGAYVPAILSAAFTIVCSLLLYENNAVLICSDGEKFRFRKFLRHYECEVADASFYNDNKGNYIFRLKDNYISVPYYYTGLPWIISAIRFANGPFGTDEGKEFLKKYIKEKTSRPCFLLLPHSDVVPGLCSTKLGGIPYWEPGKEYPTDEYGHKMNLLCQLNFAECTDGNGLLPESGILQFFIADNYMYGCDDYIDEDVANQRNYRVVFHDTIDERICEEDILPLSPNPEGIMFSPLLTSCALEFSPSVSYMKENDYQFSEMIRSAAQEFTGKDFSETLISDLLGYSMPDRLYKEISAIIMETENYVLGHPDFETFDIRNESDWSEEDTAYFDTALLQLNNSSGNENLIYYEGLGKAVFLINSDALRRHDFSRVAYF